MYHYLFTNDLRISTLAESIKEAGRLILSNQVPSASVDKSANNNIMTLGFYFNLLGGSNCAKAASKGDIRKVVLNFIKKFQFPNPRTITSLENAIADGIILAPLRVIVKLLYIANMCDGASGYVTENEIKYFVFFNNECAKNDSPDLVTIYQAIKKYRNDGIFPPSVERNEANMVWAQPKRQIREMLKVLCWSGFVVKGDDDQYSIAPEELTKDNKADIFDILMYNGMWLDYSSPDSYREYMDISDNLEDQGEELEPLMGTDLKELIKKKYEEGRYDQGAIQSLYKDFSEMFGPSVLAKTNGKDLLTLLFEPKKGLMYTLECDKKFTPYGSCKGGSSFKFPLFFSQDGKWLSGSPRRPKELNEEDAIKVAEDTRDQLLTLCNYIENHSFEAIEDYKALNAQMTSTDPEDPNPMYQRLWVFKYLHLIFPEVFATFYSQEWIEKEIKNLGLSNEGSRVADNGQLALYAKEIDVPNACFAWIIRELFADASDDETDDPEGLKPNSFKPREPGARPLNVILYGAPGTGKTYSVIEYALSAVEKREPDLRNWDIDERAALMAKYREMTKAGRIVFTTFHQSYGYEDFIQGLRPEPTESGGVIFKPHDGVFKSLIKRAKADPEHCFAIIIDEINRANISKVLGELITLIEEDKRLGEVNGLSATLPSGETFEVPNNVYIFGTMNTADKSIALIDVALRRRFTFIQSKVDLDLIADASLREILRRINDALKNKFQGTDLLIGHAYFIGKSANDLVEIMNNKVIPLLYEYCSDAFREVESILTEALSDTAFEVEMGNFERITIKPKADEASDE